MRPPAKTTVDETRSTRPSGMSFLNVLLPDQRHLVGWNPISSAFDAAPPHCTRGGGGMYAAQLTRLSPWN